MHIAVVLASYGRPDIVTEMNRRLTDQTRRPDSVCISVSKIEDAPGRDDTGMAEIVLAPRGLCAQRNRGLDHVGDDADLIVFFDDDFVPANTYLEYLETLFTENPEIAGATGHVLCDGINGPGYSYVDADRAIAAHTPAAPSDWTREPRPSLYGCNMTYRRKAIVGLRFDETLPLYGWLEDVDFSARAARWGPVIESNALAGVHLGVKEGRTPGVQLGYSQVVNPIYLQRKGTISLKRAAKNIGGNVIANHLRALAPEPYVDRLGRVKGNWIAIRDVLSGKVDPAAMLSL